MFQERTFSCSVDSFIDAPSEHQKLLRCPHSTSKEPRGPPAGPRAAAGCPKLVPLNVVASPLVSGRQLDGSGSKAPSEQQAKRPAAEGEWAEGSSPELSAELPLGCGRRVQAMLAMWAAVRERRLL